MRTELSHVCNFRCLYCNEGEVGVESDTIDFTTITDVIRQVAALGAKSVVIIGGGEPTLYGQFKELIEFVSHSGLIPVVFTNGAKIDRDLAIFLFENNATIMLKMDSMSSEVQDFMAGRVGAHGMIRSALSQLVDVGYTGKHDSPLRLGISFVSTKLNIDGIPDLWRFCRSENIFPNHELLILRGRASRLREQLELTREQVAALKQELLTIDRAAYGYDWLPYKPLTANGCLQVFYSVYLTTKGYVRPCADIDIEAFNVGKMAIKEIIASDFFTFVRNIDRRLQGKCMMCEFGHQCIGCRGAAYSLNIGHSQDPYAAVASEDPFCWK